MVIVTDSKSPFGLLRDTLPLVRMSLLIIGHWSTMRLICHKTMTLPLKGTWLPLIMLLFMTSQEITLGSALLPSSETSTTPSIVKATNTAHIISPPISANDPPAVVPPPPPISKDAAPMNDSVSNATATSTNDSSFTNNSTDPKSSSTPVLLSSPILSRVWASSQRAASGLSDRVSSNTPVLMEKSRSMVTTSADRVTSSVKSYLEHRRSLSTKHAKHLTTTTTTITSPHVLKFTGGLLGMCLSLLLTGPYNWNWWSDSCLKERKPSCGSVFTCCLSLGFGIGCEVGILTHITALNYQQYKESQQKPRGWIYR